MKKCILGTAFLEKKSIQRYARWIHYYGSAFPEHDLVLGNDGAEGTSAIIAELYAQMDEPVRKRVRFCLFSPFLGRKSVDIFPGWRRSFSGLLDWANREGYGRVVFIETDLFIRRRYIRRYSDLFEEEGFRSGHCGWHGFMETSLQILNARSVREGMVSFFNDAKELLTAECAETQIQARFKPATGGMKGVRLEGTVQDMDAYEYYAQCDYDRYRSYVESQGETDRVETTPGGGEATLYPRLRGYLLLAGCAYWGVGFARGVGPGGGSRWLDGAAFLALAGLLALRKRRKRRERPLFRLAMIAFALACLLGAYGAVGSASAADPYALTFVAGGASLLDGGAFSLAVFLAALGDWAAVGFSGGAHSAWRVAAPAAFCAALCWAARRVPGGFFSRRGRLERVLDAVTAVPLRERVKVAMSHWGLLGDRALEARVRAWLEAKSVKVLGADDFDLDARA